MDSREQGTMQEPTEQLLADWIWISRQWMKSEQHCTEHTGYPRTMSAAERQIDNYRALLQIQPDRIEHPIDNTFIQLLCIQHVESLDSVTFNSTLNVDMVLPKILKNSLEFCRIKQGLAEERRTMTT